jgi:hypothetical protein
MDARHNRIATHKTEVTHDRAHLPVKA